MIETLLEDFAQLVAEKVVAMIKEGDDNNVKSNAPAEQPRESSETSYTIEEVCQKLKISKATLSRHRNLGYLTTSFYVGRSPRFTEEDIQKYLRSFNSNQIV